MFWRFARGRIDLRNHRKILLIDDAITSCGSQNCTDPEFLIKAKFAPWVDLREEKLRGLVAYLTARKASRKYLGK